MVIKAETLGVGCVVLFLSLVLGRPSLPEQGGNAASYALYQLCVGSRLTPEMDRGQYTVIC